MNSFTSRPRSPISPTTTTSAEVKRAIMPSSTDLPTPEPANRPTRWPRPTVSSELIERMPVSIVRLIGSRSSGLTARLATEREWRVTMGPMPSSGRPAPSTTRPSRASPTGRCLARSEARRRGSSRSVGVGRCGAVSSGMTWAPGARPTTSSVGIMNSFSPLKPTTSASQLLPPGTMMRQPEPSGSLRPAASITRPLMRVRRPAC